MAAVPKLKMWANMKALTGSSAANDDHVGEENDALANKANDTLLRASMAVMQHDEDAQRKYLLEGIALLKQCGNAPWPKNRSRTCADVLEQTMRENRKFLKK